MLKIPTLFPVTLLAAALSAQAAQAAPTVTLTFQEGVNGYTGTQDTMVRSNETAMGSGQSANGDSRDLSFGSLDFVSVDGDDGSPGNKPNHGLIRFDNLFGAAAGQIKASDTILSATLTLVVFDPGSGMSVYDMLTSWSESSTWNSLVNGIQTDGVEAAATPIATFGANNSNANVKNGNLVIDVTSSLQKTQAGLLPGYGWALIPFTNGTNGVDFYSSEYAIANLRPLLTVEVMPVPEPQTYALILAGLGLVGWIARRRRVA
jgi:hypothetical protein